MRRVVSLFLPTWSTDRLRKKFAGAAPPAETELVLFGREGKQQVALAADAADQARDARAGLIINNAHPSAPDGQTIERRMLCMRAARADIRRQIVPHRGWCGCCAEHVCVFARAFPGGPQGRG